MNVSSSFIIVIDIVCTLGVRVSSDVFTIPGVIGVVSMSLSDDTAVLHSMGSICEFEHGVSTEGLIEIRSINGPRPELSYILSTVEFRQLIGVSFFPAEIMNQELLLVNCCALRDGVSHT